MSIELSLRDLYLGLTVLDLAPVSDFSTHAPEKSVRCVEMAHGPLHVRESGEGPCLGPSLDATEAAERRADDALSDLGASAIRRRWRRDD